MNVTVGGGPIGVTLLISISEYSHAIPAPAGADHLAAGEDHGLHELLARTRSLTRKSPRGMLRIMFIVRGNAFVNFSRNGGFDSNAADSVHTGLASTHCWRRRFVRELSSVDNDLDVYLETYNQRRPHRGRSMEGRTPYDVFKAGIPRKRTHKPSARKEVKKAA